MFFTRNAQIQSPLDSQILDFAHFHGNPSPYLLKVLIFLTSKQHQSDKDPELRILGE